jgi:signal transduction histidine kinase
VATSPPSARTTPASRPPVPARIRLAVALVALTALLVAIAVQDSGIGIPPADIPRIFDRLHRAANVDQNIAGLGLGLYLSRALVERHGGQITVTSTLGQGSTFTVLLPWAEASAARSDTTADRQPA